MRKYLESENISITFAHGIGWSHDQLIRVQCIALPIFTLMRSLILLLMHRVINIPISLLKGYKNDKESLEMLACAFIIKAKYQHSVLYNVTVTKVMKVFGCSHKKAKSLIQSFGDSKLFIFNTKNQSLYANYFKDKTRKIFGHKAHKKYDAISDYCCKVVVKDGDTLRNVIRKFRNILLVNAIAARERNTFNVGQNLIGTKPSPRNAMPQRLLGDVIGLSRASGNRYVKRLIDEGVVGKSDIVAECVINVLNDETENAYRQIHPNDRLSVWHNPSFGGWSAWKVYGYAYSLLEKASSYVFRHVIYNYRYPAVIVAKTSCELDGKW